MGKTTTFNEEELYVVRQAIQDLRNNTPTGWWAYRKVGNDFLDRILHKLEPREVDDVETTTDDNTNDKPVVN